VPQQALFLMNSPMVIEAARKLVSQPGFADITSDEERVRALYIAIYQRLPTKQEVGLGLGYVKANPQGTAVQPDQPLPPMQQKTRDARIAARKAMNPKFQGRFSNQIGGTYDTRAPLDAWTKLAHALLQSNEAVFYR
jgi:hypothetical protein